MEIKDIKTKYELAVYMADRMVDGHDSEVSFSMRTSKI
jgi:hypothetical protein